MRSCRATRLGLQIVETWDTMGMRATRSDDTVLKGAFVPDRYIARVVPAGFAGADLFVLGIFAWAEPTFGHIYAALAQRARDLAVAGVQQKTSVALGGRTMAWNPMVQHAVAEMDIGARRDQRARRARRRRLVDRREPRRQLAGQARRRQIPRRRRRQARRRSRNGCLGWNRDVQEDGELERLYATCGAADFIPANSAIAHESGRQDGAQPAGRERSLVRSGPGVRQRRALPALPHLPAALSNPPGAARPRTSLRAITPRILTAARLHHLLASRIWVRKRSM